MNMYNPPLFEAPLTHTVTTHTNTCTCPECRDIGSRALWREWAESEWEIGPNPRVNTPLPRLGPGFISSVPTSQQFGLPETIQVLQAIAAVWEHAHPGGPVLNIRDISLRGGGPMRGHRSHRQGIDVDIRPVRNDNRQGPITFRSPAYAQDLTQQLVDIIRANGILRVQFIFFNDPAIRGVQPWPNHDDHLHIRFFPPGVVPTPPSPRGQRPVLRRGSRGPAVQELQSRLNGWLTTEGARTGLRLLVTDGIFGPRTEAAVRAFQRARQLRGDGVVGPQTWGQLLAVRTQPGPPAPAGVPQLIKSEGQPPQSTLYVNIPLGSEGAARPMTGIYIPENYHPQPGVDLILFLHGFKAGPDRRRPDPGWTINQYWRFPYRAFREGVHASHKSVILVSPTLGQFSEPGMLTAPGGFDRYIDQVMAALATYGPYMSRRPAVGNIILAAHSGGGSPMTLIALANQRYTSLIRECWAFDSMYGGSSVWADWAAKNPQARLYNYYRQTRDKNGRPNGTWPASDALERRNLPNVITTALRPEIIAHDQVPIQYWRTRIDGASFLIDK